MHQSTILWLLPTCIRYHYWQSEISVQKKEMRDLVVALKRIVPLILGLAKYTTIFELDE